MAKRWRLVMVALGLALWPAVICAGAQTSSEGNLLWALNPQDRLTNQQLAKETGFGSEKSKPCNDGKIVLWDEWSNRSTPKNFSAEGLDVRGKFGHSNSISDAINPNNQQPRERGIRK